MKLIINADDAGISPEVNEAILRGATQGVISAASVMVNMPFAAEFVSQLRDMAPTCSLGLHFCLTSGKPCLPPAEIPLLVDSSGMFRHGFLSLFRRLAFVTGITGKRSGQTGDFADQIRREFQAQVQWFDTHRVPLSFIDGHQHIQMLPVIFEMASQDARQRGIHLRISNEPFGSWRRIRTRWRHWLPGGVVKKMILSFLAPSVRAGLSRPDPDTDPALTLGATSYDIQYHGVLDTGAFCIGAWKAVLESESESERMVELTKGRYREKRLLVNIHPAISPPVDFATSAGDEENHPQICCSSADRKFLSHPNRQREWETVMGEEFRRLCDDHQVTIVPF